MIEEIKDLAYYLSLECAYKYKFAIPKIVVQNLIKKYPSIEKKELLEYSREICKLVNRMSDNEIQTALNKERTKRNKG
ncbi:MAG: hypothetical protein ACK4J0_00830 [Candidatus Anstonellaceae archaeon]